MKMITIILTTLILILPLIAYSNNIVPNIKITGDWELTIEGQYNLYGKDINIKKQKIKIEKPTLVKVENEKYVDLGIFDPKAPFWSQGVRIKGISNGETGARESLDPGSFVVKSDTEGLIIYKLGIDYGLGAEWGYFGRLANETITEDRSKGNAMIDANLLEGKSKSENSEKKSSIKEGSTVFVDYTYTKWRLDTIATDTKGKLKYFKGEPCIQTPKPPILGDDYYPVCNIFTRKNSKQITDENIYQIFELRQPISNNSIPNIKDKLPRTYDKIVNKKEITVLFWGDSVTCGGTVSDYDKYVWQNVVARELQKKYPDTKFKFETTAWGGRGVGDFFNTPRGELYNFQEHVLDLNPDLVIMEFVNDTYQFITPEMLIGNYNKVRDIFAEKNIDWMIMLPHFTDFDRESFGTEKYTVDQRWYDKWIRKEFVEKYPNIAVADASVLWGHLLYEGIPFCTLNQNGINHPNDQGHQILANGVLNQF